MRNWKVLAAIAVLSMGPIVVRASLETPAPGASPTTSPAASSSPAATAAPLLGPQPGQLAIQPCVIGKNHTAARCGTFTVLADQATLSGWLIAVNFVILPAKHETNRAIFWNPGGPGASATFYAPFIADGDFEGELNPLRDQYDVVFVDNRGTGLSHPFACDLYAPEHPELYYSQLIPDAPLRKCHDRLIANTDLNDYGTDIAADDLDAIRSALGYPKIVLDGGSYGTEFFLDYARRHPEHVESIVLQGVAPPHFLIIPLQDARGAQQAFENLASACEADKTCSTNFPEFRAHFMALVHRFDAGPVKMTVVNVATHASTSVSLSKEVFADRLRQSLYSEDVARYVPFATEHAYHGDYGPLADLVELATDNFGRGLDIGLNLSVTCAEDIPFIKPVDIARTTAGTFEGDARVRSQEHACAIWNVRPAPAAFQDPVHTTAPVLMISGGDDPTTPPSYGTEALAFMPNGRQLIIPNASHDSELACADALIVKFVHTRDAKALDATKCIGSARRPPFATSMQGLFN
jgi:pimeloyl-ACP methyl ester carboxylesterase